MTKYVLKSGNDKSFPDKERKATKEILSGLGKNVNILYCLFAQPREDWAEKYDKYKEGFSRLVKGGDIRINFDMAFPDKFEEQAKRSDVIMIQGGDDYLLQYWLKQFDLPKLWEGKVVVASSAGSDALATSFWTCDWRKCMDGLGIVPVKFVPHYKSKTYGVNDPRGPIDWKKAYNEITEYGDKTLPVHALEEGNYIVIEQ